MNLAQRTAVITGGASGLGEATVQRFVRHGANVVILDLNRPRGEALAASLGSQVAFQATDITRPEEVQLGIDYACQQFGSIHVLVNCAALPAAMKTTDTTRGPHHLDLFRRVIDVNLVGTFDVIRTATTRMLANEPDGEGERGVIINTASAAAFDGQVGQVAYAASKAAIAGMTLPMARDLAEYGIRVCTIAPGLFDMRLGKPDEYARLAQHVVENPMLNGEVIRLDGALRMPPR
ncbi:MAG: SDR family NAD(P)-dependent oxidoreductase [Syntrophomonadaceae bacterium]|nr:SDR family NAD(P)-dependent oxidoreductase [Syntrophomonadaceae bacterium]